MRLWRQKASRPKDRPPVDDRPVQSQDPLRPVFEGLMVQSLPASLTPGDNPEKDRVFDDEIDPSWRDPDTTE